MGTMRPSSGAGLARLQSPEFIDAKLRAKAAVWWQHPYAGALQGVRCSADFW